MFSRAKCAYRLIRLNFSRGKDITLNNGLHLINRQDARNLNHCSRTQPVENALLKRKFSLLNIEGKRSLFSPESLGYDGYKRQKAVLMEQVGNSRDNFFERILVHLKESEENPVFSEDLKAATYLAETDKEIEILSEMARRYYKTNISLKLSTFVFGPIILRLLHIQNKPDVALSLFKDPTMNGFFNQMASFLVYMDLMYINKRYLEVLEAMDVLVERSVGGLRFSLDCLALAAASCYKLNTPEHLEKLQFYLKKSKELDYTISMRTIIYGAMTAYNQKNPKLALEILNEATALQQSNLPVALLNVKILVLTELNQFDDAVNTMKLLVQNDEPFAKSRDIFEEVLNNLEDKLSQHKNKILLSQVMSIKKDLKGRGRLISHPFLEYLDSTIHRVKGIQTGYKQRRNSL